SGSARSIASAVFALRSPRFDPMPMCTRCGMTALVPPQGRATVQPRRTTLRDWICCSFSLGAVARTTIGPLLTDSAEFYKLGHRAGGAEAAAHSTESRVTVGLDR